MAYIGAKPVNGFFEKQQLSTDGSTTTFALNTTIGSTSAILVVKDGVVQEPEEAYTLSGGGTSIVFASAPSGSADTYVHFLGQAIVQTLTDVNGVEFILDADADTCLTADTDDEIDIRIAGNDVIMLKQSSGDGIITIPVDAKDLQFTQFDGHKVLEINDAGFVGVGGNSNAAGEIRIFEDTDNG